MEIAIHTNDSRLLNNKIFELDYDRDNILLIFRKLKFYINQKGHNLNTFDLVNLDNCDIILYFDIPLDNYYKKYTQKNILIILENKYIWPQNWQLKNHNYFQYVLTWDYTLVDNSKYFLYYIPQDLSVSPYFSNKTRKKFTLISSNKINIHKDETYNFRKEIISYFERNSLDFDFYGFGWDKIFPLNSFLMKISNKLQVTKYISLKRYKNYKGQIESKEIILSNYNFCFCFENAFNVKGYITEKIFDSFRTGTIPIYIGDSYINKLIPEDCFYYIDNHIVLDNYISMLNNIDQKTIDKYRRSILKYLESNDATNFTFEFFNNNLYSLILKTIK
jgi:alpha(1,3/1,4) fucosyltransferase